MKKVDVLFLARHRDEVLAALRSAGVVHLAPAVTPAGVDLDALRKQAQDAREDISRLAAERPAAAGMAPTPPPPVLLEAVRQSRARVETLEAERALLSRRLEELAPFGDFDPASFGSLADAGRPVRLLRVPASAIAPAAALLHVLHRERATAWAVQIGGDAPVELAEEIPLPSEPPAAMRAHVNKLEHELAHEKSMPARAAASLPALRRHLADLESSAEMLAAKLSLSAHGDILVLEGFAPADQADALERLATSAGWGIRLTDPAPEEDPPTLIRNPVWVRPVESVLKAIGIVPGYREVDISAAFLLFFSLFFAMLVGDAGYGAVFLGLTILACRKMPSAPPEAFRMMAISSLATMIWGGLTGTFFGMVFTSAPLAGWAASDSNVMHFCFLIGASHLTIAHAWAAIRMSNHPAALAQIGYILTTWVMYFMADQMVLGRAAPEWVGLLFLTGLALIVLFMTPVRDLRTQWFNHVMLPLSLVGNFVDVISYLRLFAVGFAGLAMASTFNEMAGAGSGLLGGLAGVLILLVGHGLNLTLAAMGVLVHGVRLNTLEFSSHIGNQWSGRRYEPFAPRIDLDAQGGGSTTAGKGR